MENPIISLFSSPSTVVFACGLLLPKEQENAAIALSQEIAANNPTKFVLNLDTRPPYLRLYETIFPTNNVSKAEERLRRICSPMTRFHMNWGAAERTDHLVSIWGELNEVLSVFHEAVLLGLNELRTGYFKEKYIDEENKDFLSGDEEASLQKWGSPWAEPYVPHMIISKAIRTFVVQKASMEWKFEKCLFQGLVMGIKTPKGDFSSFSTIEFKDMEDEPTITGANPHKQYGGQRAKDKAADRELSQLFSSHDLTSR